MAKAARRHSGSGLGGVGVVCSNRAFKRQKPSHLGGREGAGDPGLDGRCQAVGCRAARGRTPPPPPADSDSPGTVTAGALAPGCRTGGAQTGDRATGA